MSLGRKIAQFAQAPWQEKINRIHGLFVQVKTAVYCRKIFAEVGTGMLFYKPLCSAQSLVESTCNAFIGESVTCPLLLYVPCGVMRHRS